MGMLFDGFGLEDDELVFDARSRLQLGSRFGLDELADSFGFGEWAARFRPEGLVLEHRNLTSELFRWRQHADHSRVLGDGHWSVTSRRDGRLQGWVYVWSRQPDLSRRLVGAQTRAATGVVFKALCEYVAATPQAQEMLGDRDSVVRLRAALGPNRIHFGGVPKPSRAAGRRAWINGARLEEYIDRCFPRLFAGHFVDGESIPHTEEMVAVLRNFVSPTVAEETWRGIVEEIVDGPRWNFGKALGLAPVR